MGKWGLSPSDLAMICGVDSYYDLLGDRACSPLERLGPTATTLTGQLGQLFWAPGDGLGAREGRPQRKSRLPRDHDDEVLAADRQPYRMGDRSRMAPDIEVDGSLYRETFQRVAVAFERGRRATWISPDVIAGGTVAGAVYYLIDTDDSGFLVVVNGSEGPQFVTPI